MISLKARLLVTATFATLQAGAAQAQAPASAAGPPAKGPAATQTPTADSAPPSASSAVSATAPAASASSGQATLEEVVVTARRTSERLDNVPVAVSVLQPTILNSKAVFNPTDLSASVPGLSVAATIGDRNNVTYSIRGQGFAYGTLFPAVITYFNEVPITQLTAGQFFDLANVQVLRGPQGVNFGRVTDGGNVLVTAQEPKNDFDGYLQVKAGDYGLKVYDAALNVPVVNDRVLIRGAIEIGRRDGFTKNQYNGRDLDNIDYESYRIGVKLKITDTLTNTTTIAYQNTHDNGTANIFSGLNPTALNINTAAIGLFPGVYGLTPAGQIAPYRAGLTPLTPASYLASEQALLAQQQALGPRKVYQTFPSFDHRNNFYLTNATNADLPLGVHLTNIFGYVAVRDDEASSFDGSNGDVVYTCHSACGTGGGLPFNTQQQYSEEIRLSGKAIQSHLSYAIGGYADEQKPDGVFENDDINLGILERDGVQYTKTKSKAVYLSGEYDLEQLLPGLKFNGGVRYTHDTVDSDEATYLRPIEGTNGQQTLAAVLGQLLQAPPAEGGESLPAPVAAVVGQGVAAATYAPIPHGACTSYGTLNGLPSFLGAATCNNYQQAFDATTWQVGASYKRGSGPLLYVKASKGYRPGGVNGTAPTGVDPTYQPEFDTSVELGVKSDFRFHDMQFRTAVAAYHDDYDNIQKGVVVPNPSGLPLELVRNVDDATVQGVEFEGAVIPIRGLTLGANFDYTDAEYDKNITFDPNSCNPTAFSVTGFCPFNRFAFTPRYQYTLNGDYVLPLDENLGKVDVSAQWYWQSSISLGDESTLNPKEIEKAYGYLNLNANWSSIFRKPVDIGFFMTNVTDKLYRVGTNDLLQNSSVGIAANIYAPPRMFGFSVRYHFGGASH